MSCPSFTKDLAVVLEGSHSLTRVLLLLPFPLTTSLVLICRWWTRLFEKTLADGWFSCPSRRLYDCCCCFSPLLQVLVLVLVLVLICRWWTRLFEVRLQRAGLAVLPGDYINENHCCCCLFPSLQMLVLMCRWWTRPAAMQWSSPASTATWTW